MPTSISSASGDGKNVVFLAADIVLPDAVGSLPVAGQFQLPAGALTSFSGTITCITPNGTSQQTLLVQVNTTTAVVSAKTGTASVPSPDAGNVAIASQIVPASVTANLGPSLQGGWTLANQW